MRLATQLFTRGFDAIPRDLFVIPRSAVFARKDEILRTSAGHYHPPFLQEPDERGRQWDDANTLRCFGRINHVFINGLLDEQRGPGFIERFPLESEQLHRLCQNHAKDVVIVVNRIGRVLYRSGGLENSDIRRAVCDILEGGEGAFQERARRLRVRLDR